MGGKKKAGGKGKAKKGGKLNFFPFLLTLLPRCRRWRPRSQGGSSTLSYPSKFIKTKAR